MTSLDHSNALCGDFQFILHYCNLCALHFYLYLFPPQTHTNKVNFKQRIFILQRREELGERRKQVKKEGREWGEKK